MSTLLEQASLVLIPSGYKEDVVYSQIPTSGAGDLSFTRASNGTRINSAGLVEVCPWNLLEQSETFDNAVWSKTGVTVTANSVAAPNGTTTADTLVFGASSNEIVQSVGNLIVDQTYTLTIYLRVASGTATMYWGNIDYTTPSITVTTEWQRFTVTQQAAATTRYPKLVSSSGVTVYAWGAQLNIGSTAKPYFPTTDRLNVPRLTYQNGGGGCPSLLLEKQSTNILLYSEQVDNGAWASNNLTITANQGISPDGTQNADLLDDGTASSTQHWIYQGITFANSTAYTISFYAKYISRQYMTVNIYNGSTSQYVDYDIQNGTILGSTGDVTASITSVGNGWYRIVYTRTMAASGSPNFRIGLADDTGSETYTGSNKQVYVWGFQCEASSYVTSYINTTSASATRVADACFKTGISSLIGQSQGTIFLDFELQTPIGNDFVIGQIYNSSSPANGIYFYINSTNFLQAFVDNSGTQVNIFSPNALTQGNYKVAIAYKANDFVFYINGVQIATVTSGTVPTCNSINLIDYANGSGYMEKAEINQYALFPTRLTNAELASLTTI